jgi:hypothetical protein
LAFKKQQDRPCGRVTTTKTQEFVKLTFDDP